MTGTLALELLLSLLRTSADNDISLVHPSIAARVPPPPKITGEGLEMFRLEMFNFAAIEVSSQLPSHLM